MNIVCRYKMHFRE